jgi:two-component system response regulator VanR
MKIDILVVEDDEQICHTVKKFLENAGFIVDTCFDGNQALEQLYNKKYHLVVLDIMLPGLNGQEILRELRKISDAPVLMMTALEDDYSQIRAFNNLADDYVTKPFTMQILVKRVEALLRRSGHLKNEIVVGTLTLYPESYRVLNDGKIISLTPKEFEILLLLVQNKGKIVSQEAFLTKIWGYDFDGNEGIVHVHMRNLRNKLPPNLITTVKGVGYRLEEAKSEI